MGKAYQQGLTTGSFCSGIAAPEVAAAGLGFRPQWFSEIDPFPSAVLAERFPAVPNLGDMTKLKGCDLAPVELIVAGTPCQSFSVAGLRKGMADPRGNLALVLLGLVDAIRPRWLVWENVPGVLSSTSGEPASAPPDRVGVGHGEQFVDEVEYDETDDFRCFTSALTELGYGWAYRVFDAQYAGVPQRRRRVFVVGCAGGWQRAAAVLFERHSLSGHPAPSREAGARVAALTANGVGTCGADDNQAQAGHLVAFTCKDHGGDAGENSPTLRAMNFASSHANAGGQVAIAFQERGRADGRNVETQNELAYSLNAPNGGGRRQELNIAYRTSGNCGVMEQGDKTACLNTATDPNQNIIQGSYGVRRLTPRECERLQGFPDDWTLITYRGKPAKDGPRYKAIGNSMAVPVLLWIQERIVAVDSITSEVA